MSRYIKIGEAAKLLGVTPQTVRRGGVGLALCEARKVEVVIINQGDEPSFEEELVQDVLEIVTVFSARMYGSRSHKNRKLIEAAKILSES